MTTKKKNKKIKDFGDSESTSEREFDYITHMAALACGCSSSFIVFFDHDSCQVKSHFGLDKINLSLEKLIEVSSTHCDHGFQQVKINDELPFFVSVQIDFQNKKIGALCLIHPHDHSLTVEQEKILGSLSQQINFSLENKEKLTEKIKQIRVLESYKQGLDLHAIIARTNLKGDIVYANKKFCEISQYSEQELLGKNHRIINSGYHSKEFFSKLWKTVLSGHTWHAEVCNKAKDGSLYWVDTTIIPLKDESGRMVEFMAFRYDITDKKNNEFLLNQTQNNAHIGGWELDTETFKTKWTDETYRIHEIEVGTPTNTEEGIKFYAEHERDRISGLVKECIEKGHSFSGDFEFITAKGNKKWVHSIGTPKFDRHGKVIKIFGTFQDISEKKASELELQRAKESLELSINIAKLGFWSYDLGKDQVHWSKELFEIFPEDIDLGPPSLEKHKSTIHPEDLPKWESAVQKCITEGTPYSFVIRTYQKDDPSQIVWVEAHGQAKKNSSSEIIELFGICRDVTDREKNRYEIIRQSNILNGVLDDMPFVIWVKDKDQNVITVNQKYADFFGQEKTYFIGKNDLEIFPGEMGKKFHQQEKEVFNQQKTVKTENQMEIEGKIHFYSGLTFPLLNKDQECIGTAGMVEDITESKMKEKEYSMILDQTKIGIWKYNPTNQSLVWDKSMYELYGVKEEDFSGAYDAWSKTLHPDFLESAQKELQLALSGEEEFDTTFSIITGEGEVRYIGAKVYIERDKDGNALLMTGINIDKTKEILSEQKNKEHQKLLAQHAKLASLGELAAGVAHEINNPLAIILASSEILNKNKENPSKFEKIQKKIDKSVMRIKNIVSGLKKYSRDSFEVEKSIISVKSILKEVLSLTSSKSKRSHVSVEIENFIDFEIEVNEIQIEQVLTNLIFNAIDENSHQERPWVKINAHSNEERGIITVTDSGSGISENIVESLFDPFFTTKEVGKGTGLGLSIALGIANDHGGDLRYEKINGHTTFILNLPLYTTKKKAA